MKKSLFLVFVMALLISIGTAAIASPVVLGVDLEKPSYSEPGCKSMYCHGPEELDPPLHKQFGGASWMKITDSTNPITMTLRNTIRFNNLYAMKVMKVESADSTQPLLDLGDSAPGKVASGSFFTKVYSNARYTETFNWGNFSDGASGVIPGTRMNVDVEDAGAVDHLANSGDVHPLSGTHSITTPSNWEIITVNVKTEWGDPAGGPWENTLDIVVSQQ